MSSIALKAVTAASTIAQPQLSMAAARHAVHAQHYFRILGEWLFRNGGS